jgi:CheY-like chemotaxis protein
MLLDLNMPLIDGVRALHRLREVSSFRKLPVIILTGADDKAKRCEAAKLGIFRFLTKQIHNTNVISALDDFIDFYNNEADPPATRPNLTFVIRDKAGLQLTHHSRINFF